MRAAESRVPSPEPGYSIRMPIAADLAAWTTGVRFDDLPADVVRATKARVLDVIGLSLAGAETAFGRSVREAAVAMSSPGPCRVLRDRRLDQRHDGGVRERGVFAGARVRRHAQRIDRAHEQPVGGGRARAGRHRAHLGPRSDCRHCRRQRDFVPRRQRRPRPVSPARLPSVGAFRDLRRHLSRRAPAGTGRGGHGAGRRHQRQLRVGHPRMLGRRDADEIPAPGVVGAERARVGVPRACRHDGPGRGVRRAMGTVRDAPAGRRDGSALRSPDPRPRDALGQPQLVVQAVSRRPRPPPVHQRDPSGARGARTDGGRRRAHRLSSRRVHRADRVRAGGRKARAGVGFARPHQPSVLDRGSLRARSPWEARVQRRQPARSRKSSGSPVGCVITSIRHSRGRDASRAR